MLGEYKVNRCTRRCHALDRPLRDGEWYYSVVIEQGDDYQRRDYSAESWQGPPEGALGWWKNQMPRADQKKMVLAPKEVLVDLLRQMEQIPAKSKSRYLLALMLMRRKVVQPRETRPEAQRREDQAPSADSSDSPDSGEVLALEVIADGSTIDVPVCTISRGESAELRRELDELLYCEADE